MMNNLNTCTNVVFGLLLLTAAILSSSCRKVTNSGANGDANSDINSDTDSDDLAPPATIYQFFESVCRIECGVSSISDDYPRQPGIPVYYEDPSQCLSHRMLFKEAYMKSLIAAEESGKLTYVSAAAEALLQKYEAFGAAVYLQDFREYKSVFKGRMELNASCDLSEECVGDAYCAPLETTDIPTYPGTCRPNVAVGESCNHLSDCSTADQPITACEGDRCYVISASPGQEGETCGMVSSDPLVGVICGSGLFCPPSDDEPQICRHYAKEGETCEDNILCELGTLCVDNASDNPGPSCVTLGIRLSAGESCSSVDDAIISFCSYFRNLTCDSGVCESMGDGSQGSLCVEFGCDEGLYCGRNEESDAICLPQQKAGASCEWDLECQSLFCDWYVNTCSDQYHSW